MGKPLRTRKKRRIFDPATSTPLAQKQINEGVCKEKDADICKVWWAELKPRGWQHKGSSDPLATWDFVAGNLMNQQIPFSVVRRLGTRGVHWCRDYGELEVMVGKFGLEHAPAPTTEMLPEDAILDSDEELLPEHALATTTETPEDSILDSHEETLPECAPASTTEILPDDSILDSYEETLPEHAPAPTTDMLPEHTPAPTTEILPDHAPAPTTETFPEHTDIQLGDENIPKNSLLICLDSDDDTVEKKVVVTPNKVFNFCPWCGERITHKGKFCGYCGDLLY